MWKGANKRENPPYQNGKCKSMTAKPLNKTFNDMPLSKVKKQNHFPMKSEEPD